MKRSWALPALLLVLGACDRKPIDPSATRLSLEIRSSSHSFEESTLPRGGTLQLEAKVLDAARKEVSVTGLDWRSEKPSVATVSPTGLVTGVEVGTTRIIASANGQADTARINVAERVTGEVSCGPGSRPLSLAVGEVFTTTADQAVTLCLEGGAGGAEFAMVPFNAAESSGAGLRLAVASSGVSAVSGPPTPSRAPMLNVPFTLPSRDEDFHLRMLERSRRFGEDRLRAGLTPVAPLRAAVPKVGDLLKLNVDIEGNNGCGTPDLHGGRVVAVTEKAVVVVDTANPKTGMTDEQEREYYRSFGVAFDTLVWKVDTENFGQPTDIDENGRVLILYTRAVNEMTAARSDSYVGGFFFNRDLFPKTGKSACVGSNYAEMFYMLAPDPNGEVNQNVRSVSFVRNSTVGVLAHEFQHLINDSRRLYVNKAPVWEETWLNEGLSHIAEELVFYATSGMAPRQNIGALTSTSRVGQAYASYQAANVDRLIRYLRSPEAASLLGKDELPTRGASWAFLRYAADRRNADDSALWHALVRNTTTRGLQNLRDALGANPRDWMQDWTVSVYTDDAGIPQLRSPERYTQPSWNFRALMSTLAVSGIRIGRYPLRTHPLGPTPTHLTLQGGGAAFLRFGVNSGARAALRTTVDDLPAPSLLRISVVRTK